MKNLCTCRLKLHVFICIWAFILLTFICPYRWPPPFLIPVWFWGPATRAPPLLTHGNRAGINHSCIYMCASLVCLCTFYVYMYACARVMDMRVWACVCDATVTWTSRQDYVHIWGVCMPPINHVGYEKNAERPTPVWFILFFYCNEIHCLSRTPWEG